MAKVTPQILDLFEEELQGGAAASEATMQRVGASVNFWNSFYEGQRGWFLNGPYGILPTPQVGVDGAYGCITKMQIYGFTMYNLVAGTSGELELDIQVKPANGDPEYSLFTVRPKIAFNAGNKARIIVNVLTNTIVAQDLNTTAPTFVTTELQAGDLLTMNLVGVQLNAESCGLVLALRPTT